ncbi:unknown [Alistipes sp. CAG:831]|nr:unknown [Alistipes sp. CAG:831]
MGMHVDKCRQHRHAAAVEYLYTVSALQRGAYAGDYSLLYINVAGTAVQKDVPEQKIAFHIIRFTSVINNKYRNKWRKYGIF